MLRKHNMNGRQFKHGLGRIKRKGATITKADIRKACTDIPDTFVCEAMGSSGEALRIPNEHYLEYVMFTRTKRFVDAMHFVDKVGVPLQEA